ncbi:MAG: antibiotic biosynthesis monooxygenase family protein [Polyangiaceae bacterium]
MILEAGLLRIRPGQEAEFERAFRAASPIIAAAEGYLSHSLSRSVESPSTFLLLVRWRAIEDHVTGFRGSAAFLEWKRLLHHFYEPAPSIEHFRSVVGEP